MLSGRYVVEALLGEGAIGRVYRAKHALIGRDFAVKVMFGDVAANETTRQRFLREAEAASRLDHENVVKLVDFGTTKAGLMYIVMDLVEGRTLEAIVEEEGRLPSARVERYAVHLLRALGHAHGEGVIHRDLKPENIVVEQHGDRDLARILDFGVAYVLDPGTEERERLTRTGHLVGTPLFMAPEQAFGREVAATADLYSLGLILYYLVAGTTPHDARAMTMAQLLMKERVPPLSEKVPDVEVGERLDALITALTAFEPSARPASAAAALELLTGTETPPQTEDLPPSAEAASSEPVPRTWPLVAGAIAFLVAGAILLWATWS